MQTKLILTICLTRKTMSIFVSINKSCTLLYLRFCVERRASMWRRDTQSLVTSLAGLKSVVLAPATVTTLAGTNTADLRPANQSLYSVQLSISECSLSTLPHKIVPKYNLYKSILRDLFIDTNLDVVFPVRHIVRITFVCIHLCATRVTLRTVPR